MKSKRAPSDNIAGRDDKVIISSEYFENSKPCYICSICNRTLSRLSDAGQNNSMYFCTHCSVSYDVENENVRRESKLSVPDRNEETFVAQTPGQDYLDKKVEINHTPEITGGLKALKEKGLKITDYKGNIPKKRKLG